MTNKVAFLPEVYVFFAMHIWGAKVVPKLEMVKLEIVEIYCLNVQIS